MYKPVVHALLRHNMPQTFIVNKLLLPSSASVDYSHRPYRTRGHGRRPRGQGRHRNQDEEDSDYY